MSANTKFVLMFVPEAAEPMNLGVFVDISSALSFARELNRTEGYGLQDFEVEGWKGRDFVGAWNHTGKLIEDRKGREVK